MGREAEAQNRISFKKVCSWCGVIIRRDTDKDSHGMCLNCYARMLSEHGRSQMQEHTARWASDR